ncbi:MAG: phosphatidylserine decarboxylase family protein [Candidatus Kapabacteria bacterium]|nr:phosphatidylserine decarboxylase family protein [Candidatus Kapabacteria bacterium]
MFSKYGYDNLIILVVVSLLIAGAGIYLEKIYLKIPLVMIGIALLALTLWFFRDPERTVPKEAQASDSIIVAPADGKVVQITEVDENEFLKTRALQISIFLSPINVHVNRHPANGIVKYVKYYPGEYLVAWHPKSSELNERSVFGVENAKAKILYKQITGYLARRIVYEVKEGDTAVIGSKFGMMKFGSRMDVVVPLSTKILVKEGDVVTAAESVIALLQ